MIRRKNELAFLIDALGEFIYKSLDNSNLITQEDFWYSKFEGPGLAF